jgi:hypothetical protein
MVALPCFLLAAPGLAEKPKTVDIVSSIPLNVTVDNVLNVDELPPVEIAVGQQVEVVTEPPFLPAEILVLQAFADSNSGIVQVTIPKDMVLRTIIVEPGSLDTDPDLYNCGADVRWPFDDNPTDPLSTERYIVAHNWGGANRISLNYAMPYDLLLPKGTVLDTEVGRVGSSGYCQAIIVLTGTTR